ncbi:MAG: hypothetical protein SGARI_006948 [Bacillariaceae sp.]
MQDRIRMGVDDEDEEDKFVLVPQPGLPKGAFLDVSEPTQNETTKNDTDDMRQAPIECSICLCEYTVGSDIVWSSNPQCDHVFHAECIEQWLMKQREGPLCPCCRRDFVIDPFDDIEAVGESILVGESPAIDGERSEAELLALQVALDQYLSSREPDQDIREFTGVDGTLQTIETLDDSENGRDHAA